MEWKQNVTTDTRECASTVLLYMYAATPQYNAF